MENCYYHSGWSEAEKPWADFSATPSNESCLVVPWPVEPHFSGYKCHGYNSTVEGVADQEKAITGSSSHSQAEKRRRDRINAQLSALRQLIPDSQKMDKAALLGSAIEQVKDLKRKVKDISKDFDIPTETDEVTVIDYEVGDEEDIISTANNSNEKRYIRASICCDDRPKVLAELIRVLKGLRLSTIKADISSVGGRMKSNFILCSDDAESVSTNTLQHSLNVVLSRNASPSPGSDCRIRSKRQRLLLLPSQFT